MEENNFVHPFLFRKEIERAINIKGVSWVLAMFEKAVENCATSNEEFFKQLNTAQFFSKKSKNRKFVNNFKDKIVISQVLDYYGVDNDGKKCICPFHKDTDPSLSFNDEKGLWKCFGCGLSGNIFHLIGLLENKQQKTHQNALKCKFEASG